MPRHRRNFQTNGDQCFAVTGYKTIATQLPEWLDFLRSNFVLPRQTESQRRNSEAEIAGQGFSWQTSCLV